MPSKSDQPEIPGQQSLELKEQIADLNAKAGVRMALVESLLKDNQSFFYDNPVTADHDRTKTEAQFAAATSEFAASATAGKAANIRQSTAEKIKTKASVLRDFINKGEVYLERARNEAGGLMPYFQANIVDEDGTEEIEPIWPLGKSDQPFSVWQILERAAESFGHRRLSGRDGLPSNILNLRLETVDLQSPSQADNEFLYELAYLTLNNAENRIAYWTGRIKHLDTQRGRRLGFNVVSAAADPEDAARADDIDYRTR